MADLQSIATQFVDYYYTTFDSGNRSALQPLYRDASMLSFEGSQTMGAVAIVEKLNSLPFQKVLHKVTTLDPQPTSGTVASMVVLVTGQLLVDDGENAIHFSQIFHLIPEGTSYYVQNDVFRLNYG